MQLRGAWLQLAVAVVVAMLLVKTALTASSGFFCGGASVCCNGVSGVSCPCPGDILEDDGDNSFSGASQQGNHSAIEI